MRILIAKDEAFNFIYRANIDSLRTMGEVRFFSPLHDSHLPSCDILYLPGGYPELYLDDISGNSEMMAEIKAYAENGGRIFAEKRCLKTNGRKKESNLNLLQERT